MKTVHTLQGFRGESEIASWKCVLCGSLSQLGSKQNTISTYLLMECLGECSK